MTSSKHTEPPSEQRSSDTRTRPHGIRPKCALQTALGGTRSRRRRAGPGGQTVDSRVDVMAADPPGTPIWAAKIQRCPWRDGDHPDRAGTASRPMRCNQPGDGHQHRPANRWKTGSPHDRAKATFGPAVLPYGVTPEWLARLAPRGLRVGDQHQHQHQHQHRHRDREHRRRRGQGCAEDPLVRPHMTVAVATLPTPALSPPEGPTLTTGWQQIQRPVLSLPGPRLTMGVAA
jgi:hypothetical protein